MFDKEFYPTPLKLILELLAPYKNKFGSYNINGELLEPSAGKGDILDFLKDKCSKLEFSCIEKNQDLKNFLHSKNYNVVHNDFLTYDEKFYYDYIIMNPPFKKGCEHLLKAIDIANNTKIACILNAETIRNPFSENRKKLLGLINLHGGTVKFIKNGFINAERKTSVEVAIIHINIDKNDDFEFDFFSEEEEKINLDFNQNDDFSIARKDLVGNLSIRSKEVRKAYKEKLIADAKFNHYLKVFADGENFKYDDLSLEIDDVPNIKYMTLGRRLKKRMWTKVIDELDLKRFMSSKVIENFENFVHKQSTMAFNKDNVASFFQMIMNNRVNILEQSIIDVFDDLTSYGYTKDNRLNVEQWKTNDRYKVNQKVISPRGVEYGSYYNNDYLKTYGSDFSLCSRNRGKFDDLDKILCYITGTKYIDTYSDDENIDNFISIRESLEKLFKSIGKVKTGEIYNNKTESTFFEIKFYKKGTIHLKFKNKNLWKEFNLRACNGKQWLPNNEYDEWQTEKNKPSYKLLN